MLLKSILLKFLKKVKAVTTTVTKPRIPLLPVEIWHFIFSQLTIHELCRLCATSPYFYKLVGADYKWLCETNQIFRLPHETYARAFGEFNTRDRTYTMTSVCSQQMAFGSSKHMAVLITGLNCNHEQLLCLKLDRQCKEQVTNVCLYKNAEYLMVERGDEVFIYYVPARGLLFTFKRTPGLRRISHPHGLYYYLYYNNTTNCSEFFNGLNQKSRSFALIGTPFRTSADYTDDHQFFVFATEEKIYFYDDVTERLLDVENPFNWKEYEGHVMAKSESYVCGVYNLFYIYNFKSGDRMREFRRGPYIEWQWKCIFYRICNDLVIFDSIASKFIYHDKDDSQWKVLPSKRADMKKNVYDSIFHCRLLEDFIWRRVKIPSEFTWDTPGLTIYDYAKLIENRYELGRDIQLISCTGTKKRFISKFGDSY